MRDYRTAAKVLCAEFGTLPLEEITPRMIDQFRQRLVSEGRLSARSINKYLIRAFSIFARAQRTHELATNPVATVERQREERSGELRILTPEEIEALARAAVTPLDGALYLTAAYSGLRQGELLELRWKDVDFSSPCLHVRRSLSERHVVLPKSGKVRSVPMSDRLIAVLDQLSRTTAYSDPEDLVFPSLVGDHQNRFSLYDRYQEALRQAGLAPVRFHDLRHVFASLALRRLPLTSVQRFLGHADVQTTSKYLHYLPQADEAALLTQAFGDVALPTTAPTRAS
jgi:integrase